MTFFVPRHNFGRILIAAFWFALAGSGTAWGQAPILLAEKSWLVGYALVGLCIFLGLLAVCVPRLRRSELKDDEEAPQKAAKGQAAPKPGAQQFGQQPYGQQYGQFGQQPAYGQQRPAQAAPRGGGGGQKSRKTAGLLGIFLGGWGIHRFYLGYPAIGGAMIAVTFITCGLGAWWGLIDAIMILTGGGVDTDGNGNPLGP